MLTITFFDSDYKYKTNWNDRKSSGFDEILERVWNEKMNDGRIFRYKLRGVKSKTTARFKFYVQLNTDRVTNRRQPHAFTAIDQPFDDSRFNFTEIKDNEIMFHVKRNCKEQDKSDDYIAVNVSPLEYCHCLILPSLHERLPQVLTLHAIELAVDTILCSHSPAFRIVFNGLCAFASVNHLHLHAYHLNQLMPLETIDAKHLSGNCYVLENYPSKGYVFQITSQKDIFPVINDIHRLTCMFFENNFAHNVYLTRGLSFSRSTEPTRITERDAIRIYVWARTHSIGAKHLDDLNPAACDLFGHILMKTEESFSQSTEEDFADMLSSLTDGPYYASKEKVKQLFEQSI